MAKIVPNGYMTLKVELAATKIVRTIVVPEHMTLEDLHDAIQAVMGWEDAHLWHFTDRRRDGVIYELPHEDDGSPSFSKRLTIDASKMTLRKVLSNRGAKLYYEYDFGDACHHAPDRSQDARNRMRQDEWPGRDRGFRRAVASSGLHRDDADQSGV